MMKTWLCAIGAALLLALALAGCRQEGNDPSPGSTGEQQETAAQSDALRGMLRGRLGELQLVRSDTMNSGEVSIVLAFRQAAQDAAGEELKLVTDFEYAYPVQAFELVIGSTGREGTHFSLPQGEALPAGAYRVDIVGSRNVTVQNGFFRNNDDCIAIKSWGRDVQNVRICGNVFWNDLYGNGLEIGYETRCESISDIVFEDNDIIHVIQGATMSIHLGDRASVSNVRFRDIRVEDSDGLLVEMFIRETNYSQDAERGHIRDVTIEDIQIVGGQLGGIAITGYDAEHRVEEVSVSGITYLGESLLTFPQELLTLKAHTANIRYEGSLISE